MLTRYLSFLFAFSTLVGGAESPPLDTGKVTSWGVYQIHWGVGGFEAGLKKQINQLEAVPKHVLFFRDLHPKRGFPTAAGAVCKRYGATPVISKELWIWGQRRSKKINWLDRINSGQTDEYWRKWGKDAKTFAADVVLRFGFEMNGDWFAWGQQPEAFISAWRRVHSIIHEEVGARNVQFMFSPNVEWDKTKKLSAIELYYPGDEFVDLLGLDGYNFGDSHSKHHSWQPYDKIFENSIAKMSKSKKPLILAEIGCAEGPRKAQWIKDFLESVRSDSRVMGFIYYNHFDPSKGEPNWLLSSDQATLQIFKKAITKERHLK